MAHSTRLTTRVSTKGQVILPKSIRQTRRWKTGTCLVVRDTPDGVLLTAAPAFAPTEIADVIGMLPYSGEPKTVEDMDAAIADLMKRRHAGD